MLEAFKTKCLKVISNCAEILNDLSAVCVIYKGEAK